MVRPKIEQHKTKSITVIAKVVINLEVAHSKRQLFCFFSRCVMLTFAFCGLCYFFLVLYTYSGQPYITT